MHVCKICGETDLSKFGVHSTSRRPHGFCRKCRNDRHREKSREYYRSDKGKQVKSSSDKKYYLENIDSIKEYNKAYRAEHSEILAIKKKERYTKLKESILHKCKIYKKLNSDKVNTLCAKRRANKLKASPYWGEFNKFIIQEAYSLSKLRTNITGIVWHVDHILPLNGEGICGLHVGINLQVIPKIENLRKSNKLVL